VRHGAGVEAQRGLADAAITYMSVFPAVRSRITWVLWVTALSLVLGGLLAASLKTQRNLRSRIGIAPGRGGGLVAALYEQADTNGELQAEIAKLRKKNSEWEEKFTSGGRKENALGTELQDVKVLAGLVPVKGPGVIVTLQDTREAPKDIGNNLSPETMREIQQAGIVHDSDIRLVIDELFAAGAEAVAVKEQRVVARTAVRCVGPSILVNDVKMASPFVVKAIGNSKEIMSALRTPGGLLDGDFATLGMIKAETADQIELPPYTGSTLIKYAQPEK
jgi:uncharacterized protein YlxW (UPF0749 family)